MRKNHSQEDFEQQVKVSSTLYQNKLRIHLEIDIQHMQLSVGIQNSNVLYNG